MTISRNKLQNYCFFVALIALSLFSISFCTEENEFYIGGNFLEVFQDQDGNIKHAASLVAYSFETELLDDDFGGIFLDDNNISNMVATLSGIYATGPFSFVDYDYSNTITQYDADDDEWTSLNEGIWCSDCVRFIAGVGSTTVFFAGDSDELTTLETLPGVNVDGIVMMDVDSEDFSALLDPNDVFPASPNIQGLAGSPLGDYLYIFETNTNTIYQYDVINGGFVAAFSDFEMTIQNKTLTVASNGDIYAFAYDYDGENVTQSIYYWPANFTQGMDPKVVPIKRAVLADAICNNWPTMTPYKEGVLVSIPDPNTDPICLSSFSYVSGGVKSSADVLPSKGPVAAMAAGINDEVWASFEINNNNILYYFNSSLTDWILISLADENIDTYNVNFLVYFTDKSSAYISIFDYDSGTAETELVRVKSDNLDVVLKSPGSLSSPGHVNGLAYDSDNEALFVGGYYDKAGKGGARNLGYYSFKDKDWVGLSTPGTVQGLASIESVIYVIYTRCGTTSDEIPFTAYSISDENVDVNNNLPVFYADNGCLYSINSNSSHVYIGGQFTAQIDLSFAYGLLIYDVEADSWSTLPIDSSITDSDSFAILTIEEFQYNDVTYVAFGGTFSFTTVGGDGSSITYNDIALYDVSNNNWIAVTNPAMITVNSIVYMYDGVFIIGGTSIPGASAAAVKSYNISTSAYSALTGLLTPVETLLLYTQSDKDDNPEWTAVYAGGHSATGVAATNFTAPSWQSVGNVYDNMYTGYAKVLQYSTGGQGSNGQNGDNSNGGGGSDWWWITLIVLGVLVFLVIGAVLVVGASYFVYQRRTKSKYDSL